MCCLRISVHRVCPGRCSFFPVHLHWRWLAWQRLQFARSRWPFTRRMLSSLVRCLADRDRSSARAGAGPRLVLVCYSVGEVFACRSGRPELLATNEWSRLAATHHAAGRQQTGPCKKWDHDAARKAFFFFLGGPKVPAQYGVFVYMYITCRIMCVVVVYMVALI
jgi:hypothetical protein